MGVAFRLWGGGWRDVFTPTRQDHKTAAATNITPTLKKGKYPTKKNKRPTHLLSRQPRTTFPLHLPQPPLSLWLTTCGVFTILQFSRTRRQIKLIPGFLSIWFFHLLLRFFYITSIFFFNKYVGIKGYLYVFYNALTCLVRESVGERDVNWTLSEYIYFRRWNLLVLTMLTYINNFLMISFIFFGHQSQEFSSSKFAISELITLIVIPFRWSLCRRSFVAVFNIMRIFE